MGPCTSSAEEVDRSIGEAMLRVMSSSLCYMSLVAHYIDVNWVMQSRVISFVELEPPYSGIVISQAMFDCIANWKLEDKVATVILDNASSNDVAARHMMSKFISRGSLHFNGRYFHIRCCAHILNLLVNDGMKPLEPLINKIRETVKYFKKSPACLTKFSEICKSLALPTKRGLVLDVSTRWGSTYKMLDCTFDFKIAFTHYGDVEANYKWEPLNEEWVIYDRVRHVLKILDTATTVFSGSTYPTANLFFSYIVDVKVALDNTFHSNDEYLKLMGQVMLEKFDKYWSQCSTLLAIAAILDPRYKMKFIQWCFRKIYEPSNVDNMVSLVRSELDELYNMYELERRHNRVINKDSLASTSSVLDSSSTIASISSQFHSFLRATAGAQPSKSDLIQYLDDPNSDCGETSFNILEWWKVNSLRYPIVSKMAKDILTIPVSTVSSESAFSAGGRVLDDYRSSLEPSMVEVLICTSSWIRGAYRNMKSPLKEGNEEVSKAFL